MSNSINPPVTRGLVVALARRWIGTPYQHQASCRAAGADCVGLVRGVWREIYGHEPEALPGYSRDWAEATGDETLLEAARRHLVEIAIAGAQPGDVLVFRYRERAAAKHVGFLCATGWPSQASSRSPRSNGERASSIVRSDSTVPASPASPSCDGQAAADTLAAHAVQPCREGPDGGNSRNAPESLANLVPDPSTPRRPRRHVAHALEVGAACFTLLHAVEGVPVAEVPLGPWWRRRVVAAFAFPGIVD